MKLKKIHNLLFVAIFLVIFSIQLIGLGVLFVLPVKIASADVGVDPKVINNTITPGGVTFTPQVDIPGSEFTKGAPKGFDESNRGLWIAKYIQAWYKFAVAGVGILAVVMIMAGGLIWLTAGGKADQVSTAKDWIMGAVTGLILALMSYTLLDILNPNLVTFQSLKIPEIELVESGLCCISDRGVASAAEAKSCTKNGGKICNILQACRLGEDGLYSCTDITEGASCSNELGSTETCPEGWFCINDKCSNGSIGDSCDMEKTSCAPGYYCAQEPIGAFGTNYADPVCYDGADGDVCDSKKTDQCNKPMCCIGGQCAYDRDKGCCLPNNSACSGAVFGNNECCSGQCKDNAGPFTGNTCVSD